MPWVEMYRGGMEDIPPYPKPNRADFPDARAYKSAYEKWRYVTVPGAKERACQRSIQSRKNDPLADEKRRAYQNQRYQNDDIHREKINAKNMKSYYDNHEERKAKLKAYWHDNKDELKTRYRGYYQKYRDDNRDTERERYRQHYQANPDYYQVKSRIRQEGQLQATPKWLTKEQKAAISTIYRKARQLTKLTGVKHVVDHIGPLNGKNSCGLHVPWNLQVIPETENLRKGRKESDDG
jgi:hypothetical protein